MKVFLVKFISGWHDGIAVVLADSPETAKKQFLDKAPTLRDYNIKSIRETNSKVFITK